MMNPVHTLIFEMQLMTEIQLNMKTSVYEKGEAKYIPYNSYGDSLVDRMTGIGEVGI